MLLENNPYCFDVRVRHEAITLAANGYMVSVICPGGLGELRRETIDGVRVYRYPAPRAGSGFLAYVWEYSHALAATFAISLVVLLREGFDILHAHCPPDMFVLVAMFYKLLGKRFVYDHHDLGPEMYRARFRNNADSVIYRALLLFEKLCLRLADHVITTNLSYKTLEMERGGVPSQRIAIVRNGIDLERMQPVDPDLLLRHRAHTILGYVGAMGPQDGVDYLVRALYHLIYDLGRHDVCCVIIGKGDVSRDLKALAEELHVEDHIWFTGWIPDSDLIRYLSTVDICVDPDPSNPFNDRSTMIKMMEYMALGKPIVAFDLPEHRVTAQDAAAYARANDELDFARQIASLMDDPERRNRMGQLGRQRIETELAWVFQEKHLLEAYEALSVC